MVLRVNDRGPFVNNRVIDVSRRAAQMLGFKEKGTAKVRVEVLPEESKNLKRKLLNEDDDVTPKSAYPSSNVSSEKIDPPQKTPDMFMPKLANNPPKSQKDDEDGWIVV